MFGTENDTDTCGSYAAIAWHDSHRLLRPPERLPILLPNLHRSQHIDRQTDVQLRLGFIGHDLFVKYKRHRFEMLKAQPNRGHTFNWRHRPRSHRICSGHLKIQRAPERAKVELKLIGIDIRGFGHTSPYECG